MSRAQAVPTGDRPGIVGWQAVAKRTLDVSAALVGLLLTGWLIVLCAAWSARVHGASGFFVQERIGRYGRHFRLIKLRTMKPDPANTTSVTTTLDTRITPLGAWLRRTKVDELPQLINVLIGDMSLVGPRPDVPGFADRLEGEDRIVLSVRPGITGPATLRYRDEERILAEQDDPEVYNRDVVYPHKVALNRAYIERYSFWEDLKYLWETVVVR